VHSVVLRHGLFRRASPPGSARANAENRPRRPAVRHQHREADLPLAGRSIGAASNQAVSEQLRFRHAGLHAEP
jgi:hypothetical protein